MTTPKDLENPQRKSGYDHVLYDLPGSSVRPYLAQDGRGKTHGDSNGAHAGRWRGPRRATALEAAQDYCDWVNGQGVTLAPQLKSAGHTGRRGSLPSDPEVEAALGVLRDAKGQAEGKQGYVYCISDGTALKIGYSTNPAARVAELQTGNPRRLYIVDQMPGTLEDEAALHQKYIHLNILQEWFGLSAALMDEFRPTRKVA